MWEKSLTYCIKYANLKMPTGKRHRKEAMKRNMAEASRIILGLRAAGWDERSINDFILWVESGEEQYKPSAKN